MHTERFATPGEQLDRQLGGYLGIGADKVEESCNAGFSMYVAAWPLLETYPGNEFQTGLFGTWMHPQYDGPIPDRRLYCDIEGGLGWWRDTRFATETPKFAMGGVALNFVAWANGPGAGKGRSWEKPLGKYGVAQLSPWVLWPPDGLNLKQGTCGELWGYGYLPLPLLPAKSSTAGVPVATGDNCWTLFLNTGNFKGPVAFFTPYFFSSVTAEEPDLAGLFLDSRPGKPNRPLQMETQHIPSVQAADRHGTVYARVAPTSFPRGPQGESPVMHQITAYDRTALYDAVKPWLEGGGDPVPGAINSKGAVVQNIQGEIRASWAIFQGGTPKDQRVPLDWPSIATAAALDPQTYGYRWNTEVVKNTDSPDGPLVTLPEYYRLEQREKDGPVWVAVQPEEVPAETGLAAVDFTPEPGPPPAPYETPQDPESCWKNPGPVAGPFKAFPGDGSTLVYYWYRFADQPALLNADLSDQERETLQKRVEKLHRQWQKDDEYLPPPQIGELADIDPALILRPPPGLEAGYVPIVTWQGIEEEQDAR